MSRSVRLLALALGVAIAAIGCGPSGATGAPPTASPGSTSVPGSVAVQASEFAFSPSSITVPAGPTTFRITNVGQAEHEFEIFESDRVVDEVEGLVPGLTRDLTVTLEAGAYTFVCKLAGHEEAGMKGTLTVTGP